MKCPYCGYKEDRVIDSRSSSDDTIIRRRRECLKCGKRFTTYEKVEHIPLMVIKKDGRREEFDREKILNGIRKACEKRPVSIEKMEEIVNKIEAEVEKKNVREISTRVIGQLVMKYLHKLDQVAYVRFASVYKEFKDIEEFKQALD
ncbi:MAG TPA: transcriptional repressor NrdR, partial [Candidatus Omnitrophica bacterium]|nr:transcriptional repressor NrdR [Candidatus Omnitrophota bacterium]